MTFRDSTIRPDLRHDPALLLPRANGLFRRLPGFVYPPKDKDIAKPFPRFDDLDHFARAVIEGRVYEDQP